MIEIMDTLSLIHIYYDIGYYNSAIVALRNAIELYPETNHRELLSYLIVRSHYLYAKNSIPEKQRQRYMDLQDAYYSFVAEYPESSYRKEVDKMQEEAKKFLARYSEKEQAKEAAAEAKKAKTEKPVSYTHLLVKGLFFGHVLDRLFVIAGQ